MLVSSRGTSVETLWPRELCFYRVRRTLANATRTYAVAEKGADIIKQADGRF